MADLKNFVALEAKKLNINDIIEIVIAPNCGAVSTFIGTTRDNFNEKKVVKLVYEAYEPMAIKELQAVCNKVRSQWNVDKIAIYHRLGEVSIMEASIVIAISSIHRQESLQAVQFTIDAIKSSVPIWKKEVYENDEPQWKENKECFWTNGTRIDDEKTVQLKEKSSASEINYANIIVDDVEIDLDNIYETVEIKSENINDNSDDQDEDSDNEDFIINPDEIQIKADDQELNRRIESFIARKREQVNLINIQEFCTSSTEIQDDDNDDNTCVCARVNAIFIKHKHSTNHVKVRRVYNQWSQQNMQFSLPFKAVKSESNIYPSALEERLSVSEKVLGINKPVPRDIYKRIKHIEDRLLFLESISPEYKDLWSIDDCDSVKSSDLYNDKTSSCENSKPTRKRTYSSTDPDSKLNEFDYKYARIDK